MKQNYESFEIKFENQILNVILNRKKPDNVMNKKFFEEIHHLFKFINNSYENDIRCVVISSSAKNFTFGLDLKSAGQELYVDDEEPSRKSIKLHKIIRDMQKQFDQIDKCRVPIIAIVNGLCLGAGIDLLACCDIVLAQKNAKFSIREVKIGMTPDLGTIQRLSLKSKNYNLFTELCFTGRFFNVQEAMELGLIYDYYDQDSLINKKNEICQEIVKNSPVAIYAIKESFIQMRKKQVKQALEYVARMQQIFFSSEDVIEAFKSTLSKSSARYPKL